MSEKNKKQKNKLPAKVKFNSFMAGIKKSIRVNKKKFLDFLKSNSFTVPFYSILTSLANGLMFAIGLSYFIGFRYELILIFGFGWYIVKKELLPELKKILSSINIIKIGK